MEGLEEDRDRPTEEVEQWGQETGPVLPSKRLQKFFQSPCSSLFASVTQKQYFLKRQIQNLEYIQKPLGTN